MRLAIRDTLVLSRYYRNPLSKMSRERSIAFYVRGAPIPQGSLTAHATRRKDGTLFAAVHYPSGSKLHAWRRLTSIAARKEWGDNMTYHPVRLQLIYYMKRPLSHYRTVEMLLKPGYDRLSHETTPDLDKLVRATMDALTDVVYADDKQVVEITAFKFYVPRYTFHEGLSVNIHAVP